MTLKFKKYLIFSIPVILGNISAMTQVVRKSPTLASSAVTAGRNVARNTSGAIGRSSTLESPIFTRSLSTFSRPQAQVTGQAYNQAFKKQINPILQKKGLKTAAVIAATGVGIATLLSAEKIADTAQGLFNMAMFDEDLISDSFSNAIVKIYNIETKQKNYPRYTGSAFIVRSDEDQRLYFVLTAAHCLEKQSEQFISVNGERISLKPIIVDDDVDIAILLIDHEEVESFELRTQEEMPFIPAKQLSQIGPHKNQVAVLQGYPGIFSYREPYYRIKTLSKGPAPFKGHFFTSKEHGSLSGASGSPLIVLHDKKPYIMGIHVTHHKKGLRKAAGAGELPDYLQEAEQKLKR